MVKASSQWIHVAAFNDVPKGEAKAVKLGEGRSIALFNVDGEYYAIEDVCTHDGAPLAHGRFRGEEITCPRHGARFDLRTGTALTLPAYLPVATYPVRVRDDGMIVIDVDGAS